MTRVGVHLIFGANPEPFLEAAVRSVDWADYVCAVNTAPGSLHGNANERTIRTVVPTAKLRLERFGQDPIDFAVARNYCLTMADDGDYVLIVDSDDVHWPEFQQHALNVIDIGWDIATAHYWHHAVYKDLLHSMRHREILFRKTQDVHFSNGVHELLVHPREHPILIDGYVYSHYGYIKPAAQVAARWELYRSLGAEIHDYDVSQPDRALDDWPSVCTRFDREHPPAVRGVLEGYPECPREVACQTA